MGTATTHDVVLLLADDNPRDDWPALAGVAHLLLGTDAKLTLAARPNVLDSDFVEYMSEVDERLGGAVQMEITDIDQLTGDTTIGLVTTPADAFGAVSLYLKSTGRAWLPVHAAAAASHASVEARPRNSDTGFRAE